MISQTDIDAMMPTGRLIAFTGPAGCGKTASANTLIQKGWVRVKFASTLKGMCRAMGMTEEMIEGHQKEESQKMFGGQTPRFIMQTLGTEWGRKIIHPDLWVNITKAEIQRQLDAGCNVVVDDCRFSNEADCVRSLGGVVVGVKGRGGIVGEHESESGVRPDYIIDNNGTLDELEQTVMDIARVIS
jgi:chloramphenicol 3-O-phosphotransferase